MPTLEELLQQSIELEKKKKELIDLQNAIAKQTLEINNAIAEEKRKKELEKIQIIIIEKIEQEQVVINTNGTPRTDVLEILRAIPTRNYDYTSQRNRINIRYWSQFLNALNEVPNVEISYLEKNKEILDEYFTEKLWKISKSDKFIIIKTARRNTDSYRIQKIPSVMFNTMVKAFTVPFSEGWRVIQVLPLSDDTEYSPDVLELIEKQVKQRQKMDEVALKQDADIPNPFTQINPENGKVFELKPFQKAGVFFGMTALGIDIPIKKPEPKW